MKEYYKMFKELFPYINREDENTLKLFVMKIMNFLRKEIMVN